MSDYGIFRIDTREDEEVVNMFIALAMELETKGKPTFEIKREQLVTGDVVVGNICFERKEDGDFIASICDGRLKEQADKMALNFTHRYYVIVGDMWNSSSAINPRAVLGAQASMAVKYGANFLSAPSKAGFAYLVYNVVKRHSENQTFNPEEKQLLKYDITPEQCFQNMLACTGIGPKRAAILAAACDLDMGVLYGMTIEEMCELPDFGIESAKKVYSAIRKTV